MLTSVYDAHKNNDIRVISIAQAVLISCAKKESDKKETEENMCMGHMQTQQTCAAKNADSN